MNTGCAQFEPELSAFLDGELDPAARARVESHLASCARCTAELRELARVGHSLRRWDAQETRSAPSHGFRNRVLMRLGADDSAPALELRPWRRGAWAAAAAAGIVGAVAWISGRPGGLPGDAIDALRARVEAAERQVADLARNPAVATAPGTSAVEPLGDLPPVVGPATTRSRDVSNQDADDPWEARAEGMLLRDVVPDFERFENERRRLALDGALQERLARIEADRGAGTAPSATSAGPPTSPFAAFLGSVNASSAAVAPFERVQVWPIESANPARGARTLLGEAAIDERALHVTEDDRGNVVAENDDLKGRRVLLVAGDVIRGGRRDRVLRESVLLEPGRGMTLPVLGAGNERRAGRAFNRSRLVAPADLRALLAAAQFGQPVGQADVDALIQRSLVDLASVGPDGSLENLWSNSELQGEVRRFVDAFRKRLDRPNVVGFVVAVGSELVGAELCGDPETFRGLRDRLLRSHILYALTQRGRLESGTVPELAEVTEFLATAAQAVFDEPVPSGDGRVGVFRSVDGRTFGTGILDGTRVVHATIFAGMPGGAGGPAGGAVRRGVGRETGPSGASPRTPEGGPDRTGGSPAGGGLDSR